MKSSLSTELFDLGLYLPIVHVFNSAYNSLQGNQPFLKEIINPKTASFSLEFGLIYYMARGGIELISDVYKYYKTKPSS